MSCVNLSCDKCGAYCNSNFSNINPVCPKCGSDQVTIDYDSFDEREDYEVETEGECDE